MLEERWRVAALQWDGTRFPLISAPGSLLVMAEVPLRAEGHSPLGPSSHLGRGSLAEGGVYDRRWWMQTAITHSA